MIDEFEIIEKTIGPVVEIEERIKVWRMPAIFSQDYQKLYEYITSQGAEMVGSPYARYQDMDWEREVYRSKLSNFLLVLTKKWHFFAGMSVSKELPTERELQSHTIGKQRYARAVHRGPYQQCGSTYKALFDWVKLQGFSLRNESIECYVNDPNEVDKADIETVILIPLKE